jgi:hypothetical protein
MPNTAGFSQSFTAAAITAPALVAAEHGLDVTDPDTIERYADLLVDVLFNGLARTQPAATSPRTSAPAPRKRRSP